MVEILDCVELDSAKIIKGEADLNKLAIEIGMSLSSFYEKFQINQARADKIVEQGLSNDLQEFTINNPLSDQEILILFREVRLQTFYFNKFWNVLVFIYRSGKKFLTMWQLINLSWKKKSQISQKSFQLP